MSDLVIFTDGACQGNPGPGGWAWAIAPEGVVHGSGGAAHTTNQRMEVMAVVEALRAHAAAPQGSITIVSDSTYVVNCFRDRWWVRWQQNGWKNSKKEPVANTDLWKPLIELVQQTQPSFRWVKGHSGDPMNDLVDRLAVVAAKGPFDQPRPGTAPDGGAAPAQDSLF
jgi:ribonuclease HI